MTLSNFSPYASITFYSHEHVGARIIDTRESATPSIALYIESTQPLGVATVTIHSEAGAAGLLEMLDRLRQVVVDWQNADDVARQGDRPDSQELELATPAGRG